MCRTIGNQWQMDQNGRIRISAHACGRGCGRACASLQSTDQLRAHGWVDVAGKVGGVLEVSGSPATVESLPREVLDLLELRFGGIRWFVGTQTAGRVAA